MEASQKFEQEIEEALSGNDEMRSYMTELERRIDSGLSEVGTPDLPPAGDLMGDLEEFLRRQRGNE